MSGSASRLRIHDPWRKRKQLALFTDDPDFARTLLPAGTAPALTPYHTTEPATEPLLAAFFAEATSVHAAPTDDSFWCHLLVTGFAAASQYERLIRLARTAAGIPHGVACVARTGCGFQGFHGRSWQGAAGNLHLTVHLAPDRPIERFESVFLALAALATIEALDAVPGMKGLARIKWVNDMLVHGAKVAGVLAHTQTRGATVTSVVLGIGINVESTPVVPPTAFVPAAGSLRDFATAPDAVGVPAVLWGVLRAIERNYRLLLEEGYRPLVDRYRERSAVLGEEVVISSDDAAEVPHVLAAGRVVAIGEGLELRLAGRAEPITKGRLILGSAAQEMLAGDPTGARRENAPARRSP